MTVRSAPMPEAEAAELLSPAPEAGFGSLSTTHGNLPLELLDVRAKITGLIADVELTQRYVNPHAEPLEATYVFPLPDRGAVTRMRMEADDRVVEGVLQERGKARADYSKAISEGRRASIAEEERPDVFTMRVGNILPGEHVTIRLTIAQPLPYTDGDATFRFPLVVAPRYIPGAPLPGQQVGDGYAPDTDAVPDASRITPPVLLPGFPNPVRLSIQVQLDPAGLPLGEVRSSLYAVTSDGDQLRIRPGERVNRDFVLRLTYGADAEATHTLELVPDADDGEGTFRLTVLPPTGEAPARPRDLVLVLDVSDSSVSHALRLLRSRGRIEARREIHVAVGEHRTGVQHDLEQQHRSGAGTEESDRGAFDQQGQEDLQRVEPNARGDIEVQVRMVDAV